MNDVGVIAGQGIAEEDLQAYIDGVLSQDRRVAVTQYLLAHPDVAERVDAYAAQRDMLRAALADPAKETVPPQLDLKRLIRERRKQVDLAPPTTADVTPRYCQASGPHNGTRRSLRIGPVTGQAAPTRPPQPLEPRIRRSAALTWPGRDRSGQDRLSRGASTATARRQAEAEKLG
jgi:anti-sigma factor RsiW